MLRGLIVGAALVVAVGAASGVRAQSAEQVDKCLDLQNRCLHHEAILCKVWASECQHPHPSSHGGRRGGGHGFGFGLVHKRKR